MKNTVLAERGEARAAALLGLMVAAALLLAAGGCAEDSIRGGPGSGSIASGEDAGISADRDVAPASDAGDRTADTGPGPTPTAALREGKATRLVESDGALYLARGQSGLYWTNVLDSTVRRIAFTGGASVLANEVGGVTPWDLAVGDKLLFYGARAKDLYYVRKLPLAGGALGTAATVKPAIPMQMIRSMATDGTNVYFTTGTTPEPSYTGLIRRLDLDEATVTDLAGYQKEPTGIAVAAYVYWTTRQGPALWRIDKDGKGSPKVLAKEKTGALGLAVDEGFVYWFNEPGLAANLEGATVMRGAIAGGLPVVVAAKQDPAVAIAVDGKYVWWATRGTAARSWEDGAIWRLTKSGGQPQLVAADLPQPWDLELTADAVYWLCRGTDAGGGGIYGVLK